LFQSKISKTVSLFFDQNIGSALAFNSNFATHKCLEISS